MIPILWSTPWFNVYSYGLCMALGYALGTWWILREVQREGLATEPVFDMLLVMMVLGVLGARLTFFVEMLPVLPRLPPLLAFEAGGLTFYGALVLSALWCVVYLRWRRLPVWTVMDAVGQGWMLGGVLARLGCFLNGCCYGVPTTLPVGICFPHAPVPPGLPPARHPTQLYEAALYVALFAVLRRCKPGQRYRGQLFWLAVGGYALLRFPLEFLRAENAPWLLGLTFSQWLSLGLLGLALGAARLLERPELVILPATGLAATVAAGVPAAGVPAAGVPAAGVPAAGVPAAGVPAADPTPGAAPRG